MSQPDEAVPEQRHPERREDHRLAVPDETRAALGFFAHELAAAERQPA